MKKQISRRNFLKASAAGTALVASGTMVGCGDSSTSSTSESTSSSDTGSSSSSDTTVSADPVKLTVHDIYNGEVVDFSKSVITKIQELVGVELTNTVSASSTDDDQAWTLMIASSDNMPDIVVSTDMSKIEQLGFDGGLLPLEDLIEEQCPNIVAAFEKYPELKTASTASDGHIYQIAGMKEMKIANIWIIRKDWLDKLGLSVPTTVDEMEEVLTAFREQDPNENGSKDETPFITRWLTAPDNFTQHALGMFCSSCGLMVREGVVVYDPLEEDFKTGMEYLIRWYANGLIDPEVYTRDDARNVVYGNNIGGLTYDWTASTTQYNTSLAESIPGFDNEVMAPVTAPNGRAVIHHCSVPYAGPGLSVTCSDVDAALKLIDFLYSEEGQILQTYGLEGETYTIASDGTYEFTEEMLNTEGGLTTARNNWGCINHLGGVDPVELEYAIATNDATLEGYQLYMDHPEWYPDDEYIGFDFKYTSEESEEVTLLLSSLNDYVSEKCMSWILGNGDFASEYDSFIAELHTRNADRVVEIATGAYARLKG
ncbi:MAG: substrate-binding domain-containing protein [Lachnospiraceae bacterium]|nr:substrate-binding domain-containing protein [Lachnospiraceae bacterium]